MESITLPEVLLLMAAGVFALGLVTFSLGVLVLVSRSMGRDVRTLTTQTVHLAQKGIAEDISGLVGNTSALIASLAQLIRTSAGVGVFLTILGVFLMSVSYLLVTNLDWTQIDF